MTDLHYQRRNELDLTELTNDNLCLKIPLNACQ